MMSVITLGFLCSNSDLSLT